MLRKIMSDTAVKIYDVKYQFCYIYDLAEMDVP